MLKVECEACKAPYQVDERRVPPSGLKMRCPKCGHSFVVANPNAPAGAPPPAPALAAPPRPPPRAAPNPMKQTMVGVGGPNVAPSMQGDDPFAGLGSSPPAARPGAPARANTLQGTAPEAEEEAGLPALPDEIGLPAVGQKKPGGVPPPRPYAMGPSKPAAPPGKPPPKPQPPSLQDFEIELSSSDQDLPSAKPAAKPGAHTFDVDLPSPAADLPVARGMAGLPLPKGRVPSPKITDQLTDLPVVAADLPSVAAGLPAVAGNLPVAKRSSTLGFGEVDLPVVGGNLPAVLPRDHNLPIVGGPGLPAVAQVGLPSVTDAQSHLPIVTAPGQHLPTLSGPGPNLPLATGRDALPAIMNPLEADFGELELPPSNPPPAVPRGGGVIEELDLSPDPSQPPQAMRDDARAGGVGYGEVDLGSSPEGAASIDAIDHASPEEAPLSHPGGSGEAAIPSGQPARRRERAGVKAPSRAPRIIAAVLGLGVVAGSAMQLTPYGAFGFHVVSDLMHEGEYTRLVDEGGKQVRAKLGSELYDQAAAALDDLAAAHAQNPRARSLTAYAALATSEADLRFGRDLSRSGRAKGWVDEVRAAAPTARYLNLAAAALKAVEGDLTGARKELDTASKRDQGDPIQQDIALTRGEVELLARDSAAATLAFAKAVQLSPSARAHFGLARAYALADDTEKAKTELAAALTSSPGDAGALALRARLAWEKDKNETAAMQDATEVTDGKAKAHASPGDLARAWALKGWIHFVRGRLSDARTAFDAASKLDGRNVSALIGEGEVLYKDGRMTEALARFDTAVQTEPSNAKAIAADAKAKIALERLADAKAQLAAARQLIPNDMRLAYWMGKTEQALGNKKAAEDSYVAAIALVDPKADDAVEPYVALSEMLAGQGRASEAQAKLDEAQKKLPDSAGMQRALGEVALVQAHYDEAVQHYQAAIAKDPQDLSSRFLLGQTFRRMQKFDQATQALDQVLAADKDYPGLSMERGLLFEQSGHLDKALAEFRTALNKAPDDPDLQLRVGIAYVGVGRPDDALEMLEKVRLKTPNSAELCHYLGRAYFMKAGNNMGKALQYLKRASELDPNRAEYHLYYAWIVNESTPPDLGLARTEIERALALDKLLGDAYWQRGEVERKEGAVNDAIKDEQRALTIHPGRFEAHAELAQCYEDKNDLPAATAEWAKAIAGKDDEPYWRFRYGWLLLDKGNVGAALPHLVAAAQAAEKLEVPPRWIDRVEFAAAQALRKSGQKQAAVEHYRRYLENAPPTSPDRREATEALRSMGASPEGN